MIRSLCTTVVCVLSVAWSAGVGIAPAHAISREADVPSERRPNRIASLLESGDFSAAAGVTIDIDALLTLYEQTAYTPLWTGPEGLSEDGRAVLGVLESAADDGLEPHDYFIEEIVGLLSFDGSAFDGSAFDGSGSDPSDVARARSEADLLLSAAVMRYGTDLHVGRLNPSRLSRDIDVARRTMDPAAVGLAAGVAHDPAAFLASLAPDLPIYRNLRRALAIHRSFASEGEWPQVPAGPTLRPDEISDRLPALRERLIASGDLDPDNAGGSGAEASGTRMTPTAAGEEIDGSAGRSVEGTATETLSEIPGDTAGDTVPEPETANLYTGDLVAAVERFQERHGLVVDGVIGPRTLAAMNEPVETRIGQIIATMERLRWLPGTLGEHYIMVNVPDFHLTVVTEGEIERRLRVIVGRPDWPTPLFHSALSYLEWNPSWTVPTNIAYREYLPLLREDPASLEQRGIQLYESWQSDAGQLSAHDLDWEEVGDGIRHLMLRQPPGPANPLGRVKFMMPNNFSVYLHDTSTRSLFDRGHRTFSHGCVRVDDPMWLAESLLDGNERWSSIRGRVLNGHTTTRVNLDAPMPLYIAYHTAWIGADEDGGERFEFREDVYGIDRLVLDALASQRGWESVRLAAAE